MSIKARLIVGAMALALVAASAVQAVAGPLEINRIGGTFSGSGGEFIIFAYGSSLDNTSYGPETRNLAYAQSFQSFCLEFREDWVGASNFVINSGAVGGGVGGSPDPISMGTAWLYRQFVSGTLAGYNYTLGAGRSIEAGLLQNAFWMLEQEIDIDLSNPYYALALANGGAADAPAGYLGIWVLNTYNDAGAPRQDMLWAAPDGGTTLMLLGGALMGLGALRRKFRS
jgi:hypothetical protein